MRGRAGIALALGLALVCPAAAAGSTVSIQSGEDERLFYEAGSGEENRLTVETDGMTITVTDPGADITAGDGCVGVTAHEATCPAVGSAEVNATLKSGADRVRIAGTSFSSRLDGGPGKDRLRGGGGMDVMNGGVGPDVLRSGGGFDFLSYEGRTDDLRVTLGDGKRNDGGSRDGPRKDKAVGFARMIGGAGDDVLIGTGADNTLVAREGADRLVGRGGDDSLNGEEGSDRAEGGGGEDLFSGDDGKDRSRGGPGPDTFQMGSAENGPDRWDGGGGLDTLQPGFGEVWVKLDRKPNDGPCADDPCTFSSEGDNALGIEELLGSFGADVLIGSPADELFRPSLGADLVRARGGDDTIVVSADGEADLLNCGPGSDVIDGTIDAFDQNPGCE